MSFVETLQLRSTLEGHNGWVTSLAISPETPDTLISGSRDKSVIVWKLSLEGDNAGFAKRSLLGHSHIVQDVAVSQDGAYVLSASWDKSMRLWSLADGSSTRFVGHEGDVLSCNFSADNNMIVSASRDRTVRIWDVVGHQLLVLAGPSGHNDWVSSAHFTPESKPRVISAGHDKLVKVWNIPEGDLSADMVGHKNYINVSALAPDGSLCASAGKEGSILIWEIHPTSYAFSHSLPGSDEVFSLSFSPSRFWIAAATSSGIKIYNLRERKLHEELHVEVTEGKQPTPTSLIWSPDGQVLYAGYNDNAIRVWQVMSVTQ